MDTTLQEAGRYNNDQNICNPRYTGYVYTNAFNPSSLANLGGYIGSLIGLSNGEQIAFEILNPSNQNWASNSYSANGNGLEQKITLKAQIKKENSPTHRLSADTYQSNITVQLTY